mmetsp:Transcript_12244/g.28834  ORF Transcript_12244/g.28834 Transcript_12244/m.28834 type:complete len:233 (+) Transcript_12244:57-755(+)
MCSRYLPVLDLSVDLRSKTRAHIIRPQNGLPAKISRKIWLQQLCETTIADCRLYLIPILLGKVLTRSLSLVDLGILTLDLDALYIEVAKDPIHLSLVVLVQILVVDGKIALGAKVGIEQIRRGLGLPSLLAEELDYFLHLAIDCNASELCRLLLRGGMSIVPVHSLVLVVAVLGYILQELVLPHEMDDLDAAVVKILEEFLAKVQDALIVHDFEPDVRRRTALGAALGGLQG